MTTAHFLSGLGRHFAAAAAGLVLWVSDVDAQPLMRGSRPSAPYRVWYGINDLGPENNWYAHATIDSGGKADPRLLEKAGISKLNWVYGSQIPTWADGPKYWHDRLAHERLTHKPTDEYPAPFLLPGIALDEWANANEPEVWDWIPAGLRQGRLKNPHAFVAVWISNTVREQLYDMGRDGTVDLFLVQGYTITKDRGNGLYWSDAIARLEPFKERGLLNKTILVLGHITDHPNWKGGVVWDAERLHKAMSEIKHRYPEMPGIAFFQASVKDPVAFVHVHETADRISAELWPDDWLPDGIYSLTPQSNTSMRLEAADAGTAPGTAVVGWRTRYPEQPVHQMWRLTEVDKAQNVYRIQPAYTRELALEATTNAQGVGAVTLSAVRDVPAQRWKLTPVEFGFRLNPLSAPEKFLRIAGSSNGTKATLTEDKDAKSQVWAINPEFSPLEPIAAVYQAENAAFTGGTGKGGGVPGSVRGFVKQSGERSTLRFEQVDGGAQGGRRRLVFRYANGSTRSLTQELAVNSQTIRITFRPTGGWGAWERMSVPAPLLKPGANNVVTLTTLKDGGPHIDKLEVEED